MNIPRREFDRVQDRPSLNDKIDRAMEAKESVIINEDDGALSLVEKDGDKFRTRRIRSGKHNNTPWYPNGLPLEVKAITSGGVVLIFVTLIMAALAWRWASFLGVLYILASIWAVGPPLWFWHEYHSNILDPNKGDTSQLDKYKYGVQTGAAIWAGVAISLGAYISSDHFKAHDNRPAISKALDGMQFGRVSGGTAGATLKVKVTEATLEKMKGLKDKPLEIDADGNVKE